MAQNEQDMPQYGVYRMCFSTVIVSGDEIV